MVSVNFDDGFVRDVYCTYLYPLSVLDEIVMAVSS
jgi:hypothetical protein